MQQAFTVTLVLPLFHDSDASEDFKLRLNSRLDFVLLEMAILNVALTMNFFFTLNYVETDFRKDLDW